MYCHAKTGIVIQGLLCHVRAVIGLYDPKQVKFIDNLEEELLLLFSDISVKDNIISVFYEGTCGEHPAVKRERPDLICKLERASSCAEE